jgi:hypothetical protein
MRKRYRFSRTANVRFRTRQISSRTEKPQILCLCAGAGSPRTRRFH